MRKMLLSVSVCAAAAMTFQYVQATEKGEKSNVETVKTTTVNDVDGYIKTVYDGIAFGKNKLSYEVFKKAYYGYLNLRSEGKLSENKDILTVCDFSLSSTEYRMWIIDLANKNVLFNDYVAHGQGSGNEFATAFSNTANSHQSSIGFYVTGNTYTGKHGLSLRLHGMDKGYNSAAFDRAVVLHGADYVSESFVKGQGRLGRSWGCPAVSREISDDVINTIKEGTAMFIYAPEKQYLQTAHWLNKKVDLLQDQPEKRMLASADQSMAKDTVVIFQQ